jgi:hypothetical protein
MNEMDALDIGLPMYGTPPLSYFPAPPPRAVAAAAKGTPDALVEHAPVNCRHDQHGLAHGASGMDDHVRSTEYYKVVLAQATT